MNMNNKKSFNMEPKPNPIIEIPSSTWDDFGDIVTF